MVALVSDLARRREHYSLLIADHEDAPRRQMESLLRTEGYETHLAAEATEAVEIVHRERIDVVILEFELPQLGGLETLRAMKMAVRSLVPCVFTAGKVSPRVQLAALSEDAFTVVPKPVDEVTLKNVVRSLIRRYFPWHSEG